jgi:hypothetical protein
VHGGRRGRDKLEDVAGPVDVVLLRGMLPELGLRPGAVMAGRVLGPRTLMLAGVRLHATLPEGLHAGQHVRLRVEEASPERVHLRVLAEQLPAEAQAAVPASAFALALPGGAAVRVFVQEREEAQQRGSRTPQAAAVVVRYDSPTLGRMDIRLDQDSAAVHVAEGMPAQRAREAATILREALARATGRPMQVTVHPRDQALDVRA